MNCILIPTYINHFKHVEKALKSINLFSKETIDIYIVVTSNEESKLKITEYNNIKTHILTLKDIISYLFTDIDEEFINRYEKFTFQSLKKLFSVYYVIKKINYKYVYVLDSEALFIRPFSLSEIIDEYTKNKRVFYNSKQGHDRTQTKIAEKIFSNQIKPPGWLLENYLWIYEDIIVNDFLNDLFNNITLSTFENEMFIEIIYYYYIFINKDKYNYTFVDSYESIKPYLGDESTLNIINSSVYLLEDIRYNINDKNINSITSFFNDFSIINFKFLYNRHNIDFLKNTNSILLINSGDFPLELSL